MTSRVGLGSQMGCCHSTTKKKAFSVQWLTGIHQHHLGTLSPPGQRDQTPVGGATVHILTPHGSCEARSGLGAPSTHAGPAAVPAGTSHRPTLSHSLQALPMLQTLHHVSGHAAPSPHPHDLSSAPPVFPSWPFYRQLWKAPHVRHARSYISKPSKSLHSTS